MRAIHLATPDGTSHVLPLCGDWISMDTGWTSVATEVTCTACAAENRLLASNALAGKAQAGAPSR